MFCINRTFGAQTEINQTLANSFGYGCVDNRSYLSKPKVKAHLDIP